MYLYRVFPREGSDGALQYAGYIEGQHTAHLTRGNVLMSDNGRAMVSIVEDSFRLA